MAEEQGTPVSQDPVQSQAAPAAPAEPVAPPAPPQQTPGPAPWTQELQTRFDPQTAAQVDNYLRTTWQPRMTQLEQQAAEAEQARQLVEALQRDPEAYNVDLNRQMYGDQYADQLAASIGRTDLMVGQPYQQQVAPQQQAAQQQAQMDPRLERMLSSWEEEQQQRQYTEAKADFLSDPQYADINSELFDVFVGSAETWEEAVNTYRAWAAHYAQQNAPEQQQQLAPPTLNSEAGGTPGSTPSLPRETLDEAIDSIFNENKPIAPPVMGQ